MYKTKITKGEWSTRLTSKKHSKISGKEWGDFCKVYNIIDGCFDSTWNISALEESIANAELIAEAGTVTNKCGFTPKELLEQRNELLNVLIKISSIENRAFGLSSFDVVRLKKEVNEAIEKTKL